MARPGVILPALLAAALAAGGCTGAAPPRGGAVPRADRIQAVERGLVPADSSAPPGSLEERMRHHAVPGVSIAVIDRGRIDWARGYGVAEAGGAVRVDTATLFQGASISKPVTAVAALRLVERGRLALDEDVNRRLAAWRVPASEHSAEQKVTLRRILTHSAGLTVSGFHGYGPGDPVPTLLQVLDGATPANSEPVRVDTVPGNAQRYSGGGFLVAQLLVAEGAGRPFDRAMHDLVFAPAGMVHSTFAQPLLPPALRPRASSGHDESGVPIAGRWRVHPEQAAAGLWSTPSDLARLAISLQRAVAGQPGLLSRRMAGEMLRPQLGPSGLGFVVRGDGAGRIFRHGGSNAGYRAQMVAFVEGGQGAVVMTNGDGGAELADEILARIAHVYGWRSTAHGAPR